MERVTKIRTHDGVLHDSIKEATRHLEKMLGDEISEHAVKLAECNGKYGAIGDYIEENIMSFQRLINIKNDLELTEEDPY